MIKIQNLTLILAVAFGIAFLDGVFVWELADGFYTLIGLIDMVCLIWLLKLVYKKDDK